MTKSTITRERLQELAAGQSGFNLRTATHEESQELARMALAAIDSEPVILYREHNPYNGLTTGWQELTENEFSFLKENAGENAEFLTLYRHAQPASEREQVRREHAEWSQATFGNVGPVGPLKHLSEEALEAAAEPGDLSEWADMQFLMWDAQRRSGITDAQITQAMIDKLAVNKQREWPEPKDGEPRLHIKEQPAPVVNYVPLGGSPYDVPYSMPSNLREFIDQEIGILFSDDDAQGVWIACRRAAMLAAAPHDTPALNSLQSVDSVAGKWIPVSERMPENKPGCYKYLVFETLNNRVNHDYWNVPDKGDDAFTPFWNYYGGHVTHWMPLPAAPLEVK